ncbi:hypothetical protein [Sinorhizobium sp. BG8]|uniref:hypothetical protein n=1 Tax=Sinorhizobium sp. BG8 TaxID=2613773 RepID=UPI00193E5C1C|nr:hypothetical protein [Sinorhizobium sp. BG8]QRM54581.1 hypothetical protein F3Y30_08505 [Sinorhizobium sp. BG8]
MCSRRLAGLALLAALAGCSQTDKTDPLGTADNSAQKTAAAEQQAPVIQGACPQLYLRDGTAVHVAYAKGAKNDPKQVLYQATLANTTRQCRLNEDQLTMTVMVQGRVVVGPAGKAGPVTLPIRVAAADEDKTLYSELRKLTVDVPEDGAAQFVFTDDQVAIPGGAGTFTKVYVGFDEGPYNTK